MATMNTETKWYLQEMISVSEKALAEERQYTQEDVQRMLKEKENADSLVTACV